MRRLTKDEYFLAICGVVATRATCDRLWASCVLTKDGEIIATGYNGAPSGMAECDEIGHLLIMGSDSREHCRRTIHAEDNAVTQARKRFPNLVGVTAYINATPCEECLSKLLRYGVRRVVCGAVYRNAEREEMTSQLAAKFGAIIEYHPMPDITLFFGTKVEDVKKVRIERE